MASSIPTTADAPFIRRALIRKENSMRHARASLAAIGVACVVASSAAFAQFSNAFAFGDSLSDAGQYGSRFTTNPGLTFPMYLTERYGISVDRQHVMGHCDVPDPRNPKQFGGMHHHSDPGRHRATGRPGHCPPDPWLAPHSRVGPSDLPTRGRPCHRHRAPATRQGRGRCPTPDGRNRQRSASAALEMVHPHNKPPASDWFAAQKSPVAPSANECTALLPPLTT